jgi:CyaY protein
VDGITADDGLAGGAIGTSAVEFVAGGTGTGRAGLAGAARVTGMKRGPFCPHPASAKASAAIWKITAMRGVADGANMDFTIRITVSYKSLECSMTESEFLSLADAALTRIEAALEHVTQTNDVDIECSRNGNVLEIEFVDNGSKIIVNSQAPMQEMWVAAKSGGFHYKRADGSWVNTRDGSELFGSLSRMLSEQGQAPIVVLAD